MFQKLKGKLLDFAARSNKKMTLVLFALVVVTICCGFAYAAPNEVTILVSDSAPVRIKTTDTNVGKILSKQNIALNEGDKINHALTDSVGDGDVISVKRAMSIDVYNEGKMATYSTTERVVENILNEIGVFINEDDEVYPAIDETVSNGDLITVISRDTHDITVQEELDYNVVENLNYDLEPGERVVVQQGQKGAIEYTYSIRFEDGVEVERVLTEEKRLSDPIDEIVEYRPEDVWQLGVIPASRPTNYKRVATFLATAYDASPADNGKWAGKTSTGMPLTYGVIAVDPNVIPYGTKMYIESVDGQYKYGYAIAGDCGGAIKGNRVDLFFTSRATCNQFGKRNVNIYFLD